MTRYRRAAQVHSREVDGEVFLIPPDGADIFYLDALGSAVWRVLPEAPTVEALSAMFADAFPEQDAERLSQDIAALLDDLAAQGFVTVDP